jgi:hypothetical protein
MAGQQLFAHLLGGHRSLLGYDIEQGALERCQVARRSVTLCHVTICNSTRPAAQQKS